MSDFLTTLGVSAVNSGLSWLGSQIQSAEGRKNLDYMMDRYYSPRAQVNNLAAAGLNPAVAMGNQSPVFSGSSPMQMPDRPEFGIGTSSLTDIGNYIKSVADAKKAGADTDKVVSETEAIKLQNDLTTQFGTKSWVLDLAQKYQNVLLAQKTNDIKDQEKAINEFKKTQESALADTRGIEKQMLQKRLDNLDTTIRLENKLQEEKVNTEKSVQVANKASANASNTQADVNRATRRLQSALADIEESGRTYKIESLISEYQKDKSISDADAKEANIKLARLRELEFKRDSRLFGDIDNFLEWIKGKVSIFH